METEQKCDLACNCDCMLKKKKKIGPDSCFHHSLIALNLLAEKKNPVGNMGEE